MVYLFLWKVGLLFCELFKARVKHSYTSWSLWNILAVTTQGREEIQKLKQSFKKVV